MNIPENISILKLVLPTISIFIFFGYITFLFIAWSEAKKDGFPINKTFDMFVFSTAGSFGVLYLYQKYYSWAQIYKYNSAILKFDMVLSSLAVVYLTQLLGIFIFSRVYEWSKYRVFDIYCFAASFFLVFLGLGRLILYREYPIIALISMILVLYMFLLRYRGYKFSSGAAFTLFNIILGVYGLAFFRRPGFLIIYPLLFAIGLLHYYLRAKVKNMKSILPVDFLERLKNLLISRDKTLRKQDKLLTEEDPFLQEGRATENAEIMDEAILEDARKELTDANQGLVRKMRSQIRKALVFMKLGRYGICEVCGKPIDRARLEIYPEATKCLDCSSKSADNS